MEQVVTSMTNGLQEKARDDHRIWRIGTYSMGLTLIGIGVAFAASLWQTTSAYQLLLWLAPVVFIMLGIELIVVHSERFLKKYKLQYNWVAVWFVGCIGAGALMLAALMSSGLLGEVNEAFHVKERHAFIEESVQFPEQHIEKIVIKGSLGYELEQQAGLQDITLLGTVRYEAEKPVPLTEQKLLRTSQVGEVLYVFIQPLEYESNRFANSGIRSQLVLNVPEHIVVEEA